MDYIEEITDDLSQQIWNLWILSQDQQGFLIEFVYNFEYNYVIPFSVPK